MFNQRPTAPISRRRSTVARVLLNLGAVAPLVFAACDNSPSPDPHSDPALTQSPLLGTICPTQSGTDTLCWEFHNSDQQNDFAYLLPASAEKVFVLATAPNRVLFGSTKTPVGYVTFPNGAMQVNITSVTAFSGGSGSGTVAMLGDDSRVYISTGKVPVPFPNGVDWATTTIWMLPPPSGSAHCLAEIEYVQFPAPALAANLLARSCDGKLFMEVNRSWVDVRTYPGFAGLPTGVTWTHLSRLGGGPGATFLTSSGDIWMSGRGAYSLPSGTITWQPARKLPPIKNAAGTTLRPTTIGGRYALINGSNETCIVGVGCSGDDDRIYWFDDNTSEFKRWLRGLPWVPGSIADLGVCTQSPAGQSKAACDPAQPLPAGCGSCFPYSPFFRDIVQIGGATYTPSFALRQSFSWVFPWWAMH